MFIIHKTFRFSAAHKLEDYDGDCSKLHGHTYELTVSVSAEKLDGCGMVIDFRDLAAIVKEAVISKLDHSYLNESMESRNPTSEIIAEYAYHLLKEKLKGLDSIEVKEGPANSAVYSIKKP